MTARQAAAQSEPMQEPAAVSPIALASEKVVLDHGRALFDLLRQKWKEVPAGIYDRADTTKLLALSDWELRDYWECVWAETSTGPGYATRGWYQEMYRDMFRGKRVLEIGGGCGIDGLHFIQNGAIWYFADVVPSNLKLIRRLLDAFGLDCEGMTYIEDMSCVDQIPDGFDFIYCNGSMINVPFHVSRRETLHLVSHLKPGGRWVELCYPQERWAREGRLPFADWGRRTDGEATPWVEWYDLQRLRDRFAPVAVTPILAFNYYDEDYNWFDFRIETVPDRKLVAAYLTEPAPKRLPIGLTPAAFKRHGSTQVEAINGSNGPALRVQTQPELWSYAVHGTLSAATLRHAVADAGPAFIPAVELAVSVQQGRVGIGLMADDFTTFIDLERMLPKREEPYVVTLPCGPGYQRYHVMLRNTQADKPSVFTLHQMVLTSHRQTDTVGAAAASVGAKPVVALTTLLRRHLAAIHAENGQELEALRVADVPVYVRVMPVDGLAQALGYAEPSHALAGDAAVLDYMARNGAANGVLINGVARADALIRETEKALSSMASGGLMLWQGFHPTDDALASSRIARAVVYGCHQGWRRWSPQFAQMFWIAGSGLLVGVKR